MATLNEQLKYLWHGTNINERDNTIFLCSLLSEQFQKQQPKWLTKSSISQCLYTAF